MVVWGLLLLIAGAITQWVALPYPGGFLGLWAVATVLGFAFQGLCQLRWQPVNFYVWVGAAALGWLFTLYVVYVDKTGTFYPEITPVWFLLLGLAYVHTGMKIHTRFYILAALHFAAALIFELVGRGVISSEFMLVNGPILFGVLAGVSLGLGAYFARVPIRRKAE